MQNSYSEEEIKNITERMEKGNQALKELGLEVAVQIIPYLKDFKYDKPLPSSAPILGDSEKNNEENA